MTQRNTRYRLVPVGLFQAALFLAALALAAFAVAAEEDRLHDRFTQAMLEGVRATETSCDDIDAAALLVPPSVRVVCAVTPMDPEFFRSTWDSVARNEAGAPILEPLGEWRTGRAQNSFERAYALAGSLYLVRYVPLETGGEILIVHYELADEPAHEPLRVTVNWQLADFPLETRVLITHLFGAAGARRADCTPGALAAEGEWRTACAVIEGPEDTPENATAELAQAAEALPGAVVINPLRQTRAGVYTAAYLLAGREHALLVYETDQGLDLLLRSAVE